MTFDQIFLRGYGLAPGNFTIAHYVELFTENEKGLSALKNSVFLAVTSATICAVLGTLLVLAVRKSHSKLRKVVEAIGLLPEMLPGIVLVIGIMLFWNQIYNILPLYNTMGIMVLAYVVLFLPYTVQYVTSSFTQISDSLMAAGQVFGGSPAYILRRLMREVEMTEKYGTPTAISSTRTIYAHAPMAAPLLMDCSTRRAPLPLTRL